MPRPRCRRRSCTRCWRASSGPSWRKRFASFDDNPAAAASIGQVHRAVWADGRDVAVKIQYPGAGEALLSDLRQIGRAARLFAGWIPGIDIKPLVQELQDRVAEELDYSLEADAQRRFAEAFARRPGDRRTRRGRAHRRSCSSASGSSPTDRWPG